MVEKEVTIGRENRGMIREAAEHRTIEVEIQEHSRTWEADRADIDVMSRRIVGHLMTEAVLVGRVLIVVDRSAAAAGVAETIELVIEIAARVMEAVPVPVPELAMKENLEQAMKAVVEEGSKEAVEAGEAMKAVEAVKVATRAVVEEAEEDTTEVAEDTKAEAEAGDTVDVEVAAAAEEVVVVVFSNEISALQVNQIKNLFIFARCHLFHSLSTKN